MKVLLKQIVLTIIIFVGLFLITPMVSSYEGTGDCGKDWGSDTLGGGGSCGLVTTNTVVFPVWRTFACETWHQPSCATDTLLPGWYDNLINVANVIIILVLIGIAAVVAYKVVHRAHRVMSH